MRPLALCLLLLGCGVSPLKLGGPNVAANVQAGAENVQGFKTDQGQSVSRVTGDVRQERAARQVRAETIDTVVTYQNQPWLIWALVLAFFLDSPLRWPEQIYAAFSRRKSNGERHA
ncbi:hypothetical protein KMP13_02375 [Epibacterium ulvae]|uniref:hypothetical protein n=1 Tax=Epibacterium ulvae TaxID=1156985 RepID=UPI001BFCAE14|nr:hypothetical protein [Epibacterium ulvae]MBT8152760.1 hypothetical protein [Epibacterium ulvae]